MSSSEGSNVLPNPLRDLHQQAEAEFQAYAAVEIVSTFGEPQAEYAAIHKGCGMMDLPQRGILELTGKDRLAFLNNLLTNATWSKETKTGLPAGAGGVCVFSQHQGADRHGRERDRAGGSHAAGDGRSAGAAGAGGV